MIFFDADPIQRIIYTLLTFTFSCLRTRTVPKQSFVHIDL